MHKYSIFCLHSNPVLRQHWSVRSAESQFNLLPANFVDMIVRSQKRSESFLVFTKFFGFFLFWMHWPSILPKMPHVFLFFGFGGRIVVSEIGFRLEGSKLIMSRTSWSKPFSSRISCPFWIAHLVCSSPFCGNKKCLSTKGASKKSSSKIPIDQDSRRSRSVRVGGSWMMPSSVCDSGGG